MEAWRSLHPGDAFLLSFYSASGWEAFVRRQPEWWTAADHLTAMPLDMRASVRSFVQAAGGAERLRGLLFAKYDVWPTLVAELIRSGIRRSVCWPCPARAVAVSMGRRLPASSVEGFAPCLGADRGFLANPVRLWCERRSGR